MQFAIHMLGFQPENILLFGWSIGAYSSLVAATQYPDVKGVVRTSDPSPKDANIFTFSPLLLRFVFKVLDATFDDVLQLAIPRMPSSISGIVRIAIRDYVNLNNTELINQYSGPVILVRRTKDEIIAE